MASTDAFAVAILGMLIYGLGRGFSDAMLTTLSQQPDVSQAFVENGQLILVLKDGGAVAPLVGLVVREGGEVQEIRTAQGSLEEVFLTMMGENA